MASHFFSSGNTASITTSKIISDFMVPLANDKWILSSDDLVFTNLTARVPGDLLSDLMTNGLIGDPYIDRNFLTQRSVWMGGNRRDSDGDNIASSINSDYYSSSKERNFQRKRTWIYSTTFELPAYNSEQVSWKLVLEGIKMGADVYINNVQIGQVADQFLRYDFDIGDDILERGLLLESGRQHILIVSFDPSIRVNGRFSGEYHMNLDLLFLYILSEVTSRKTIFKSRNSNYRLK